ncbi:MAG: SET domain-containing protein-lysine N-methyltransferase [Phycisphaerales bacterium]|nr:SET domain-containing protein-lysine N-methyltransferase [Phycisphaerales bacterium]
MKQLEEPPCLCARTRIDQSPLHGRGVFAARVIRAGEIVIENAALPLGNGDVRDSDVIARYCFEWPIDGDGRALALGEASLLNHAPSDDDGPHGPNGRHLRANLRWETDTVENRIVFYALRDIGAGEECLIDYGPDYPWHG